MRPILISFAVALTFASGTTALAAQPSVDPGSIGGTISVLDPLNWVEQRVNVPGRAVENAHFGVSVAVQGSFALVGAELDVSGSDDEQTGAVHVFQKQDGLWQPSIKLVTSDAVEYDFFGHAISMDGNTAAVSAYAAHVFGIPGAGAVYVFTVDSDNGWMEQAKLVADDAGPNEFFGASVAISGNTIVMGAPQASPNDDLYRGSAYVFVRNSDGVWSQQAKLLAPDGTEWAMFGNTVAIDGNEVIVGAMTENVNGVSRRGSANVFRRNSDGQWSHVTKLIASDGGYSHGFGSSVSLDGNLAMIGSQWAPAAGVGNVGAAYVFRKDTDGNWTERQKIEAIEGNFNDLFGNSLALQGDTAVIGSYSANFPGADLAGAAYVFMADSDGYWSQARQLLPSEGADTRGCAQYGISVALDGSDVVIGAHYDSPFSISEEGSAYFYGDIKPTDVLLRAGFEKQPLSSC